MTEARQHLSIEQFEQLLETRNQAHNPVVGAQAESVSEANRHLLNCDRCRTVFSLLKLWERLPKDQAQPGPRTLACPPSMEVFELAAGISSESEAEILLEHTATCGHCGPLLRQASGWFVEELSPEEEEAIAGLSTAAPERQAAIASQICAQRTVTVPPATKASAQPESSPRFRFFTHRFALPLAAVIVLIVAGLLILRTTRVPDVNDLLATAYAEQRRIELRIPGAKYSPLRVARGTGGSRLDRPQALLSAEDLIAKKLLEKPNAPQWLEAKARADLLDGNYDAALKTLSSLPESADVLIDLATAYYEKGEATNDPINFGNAVDALGKALAKAPNENIALYNRALVCERISLYSQAVQDWQSYLSYDSSSRWAEEAREHLLRLKKKEQQREKDRTGMPGLGQLGLPDPSTNIEDDLEYLLALLPDISLPDTPDGEFQERANHGKRAAIAELAQKDAWLRDLLTEDAATLRRGLSDLAKAAAANAKAESAAARDYASQAERVFGAGPSHNAAGELRAKFEAVFAAKVDQDGRRCLEEAAEVEAAAATKSYVWLETQLLLEQGSCEWMLGNLGGAKDKYLKAAQIAKASGYPSLYLRSQDHLSGIEIETGNYERAWRITSIALKEFWSGKYADVRGYNLYYNLYELSRLRHQPYLQLAAWRDGVKLSESSEDTAQKAMAHALLGTSAWEVHDKQTSLHELENAARLFLESPKNRSTRLAQLETESRRAAIETSLEDAKGATQRLRPLEQAVRVVNDPYLSILFYSNLGDAELKLGDDFRAESALRSAVTFAESQLRSLKSEESRAEWSTKSGKAYRNLVELLLRKGDAGGALDLWDSYRGAPLRDRSRFAPASRARSAVRGSSKSVVYALLPSSVAIWVSSDQGDHVFLRQRQEGEIEEDAKNFQRLCASSQSDLANLTRLGKKLYLDLVAPIESFLPSNSSLVIEPDDALSGLAFDALVDPKGRYLGERISMTISLGANYEQKSRPSLPIASNLPALVVAVRNSPAFPELSLPPLADAETEAELIANRFHEVRLLTGSEATDKAVRTRLPASNVFHFSGHALFSPRRSGLVLSDGLLEAKALDPSRVSQLQLVVLAACASEEGSNGSVTDGDSLVRTLLSNGVPHVVASRWEVDSRSTSEFMAVFYDKVLSGESVPTAIHEAQASLRATPETVHPFYWSAFATFGRS